MGLIDGGARQAAHALPDLEAGPPTFSVGGAPDESGVARRSISVDGATVLWRWRVATRVLLLSRIALPAVVGAVAVPLAAFHMLLLGFLPVLVVSVLGGLAAAERAACQCPRCNGSLLDGFWTRQPNCRSCQFPSSGMPSESSVDSERRPSNQKSRAADLEC